MSTDVRLRIKGEDRTSAAFRSVKANLGGILAAAKGFVGVFAAANFARSQAELARFDDRVSKLSRSLGTTTEALSRLSFAADRQGVAQKAFETGLRTVIQATSDAQEGVNNYSRAFDELGVDAAKLQRLEIDKQIEALADAFVRLGESPNRQDLAITLFGARGGLQFLTLLENGSKGIRDLGDELERLGGVVDSETAASAETAVDSVTNFQTAIKGLQRAINTEMLPAFTALADKVTQIVSLLPSAKEAVKKVRDGIVEATRPIGKMANELLGANRELKVQTTGNKEVAVAIQRTTGFVSGMTREMGFMRAEVEQSTRAVKQETKEVVALGNALDRVNKARDQKVPLPNDGRRVGDEFKGAEQGPPLPEDRVLGDDFKKLLGRVNDELSWTINDSIYAGFQGGAESAREVWKDLLRRLAADFLSSQIMGLLGNLFGGGGGGTVARLFSGGGFAIAGARAMGGPVSGGSAYLVGERGPELFFPGSSGSIAPNGSLGGVNIGSIDARGADAGVELRIRRAVEEAVAIAEAKRVDAQRRGS